MHNLGCSRLLRYQKQTHTATCRNPPPTPPYDVFISHQGRDTKRNLASLLYDHFTRRNLNPFLDNKSMKPGDKLLDKIDSSIWACKIGVSIFSPRYCSSYFCLHELTLMMEYKKKIIPIFCDVKPSELQIVLENGRCSTKELQRFKWAVEEAKHTVGLTFDSRNGDWLKLLRRASDTVVESLMELEADGDNNQCSCTPTQASFAY
ncbi:TIR-only protein-like [Telopea speciosissima]|uniref:TIR-only protein-like n=1 Tax=Telopea speciosissima TaxID=54955 RepID=UPI001CC77AA1|nr:TIR-only protein-like [Telopea speciosissima]